MASPARLTGKVNRPTRTKAFWLAIFFSGCKMKRMGSCSAINPEERSVLTANRVNVQNQKFKKELASKQRGIEDEMRCDNIVYFRRESMMQNRLNRLAQAHDNGYTRYCTPFPSAAPDNWMEKLRPSSNQETKSTPNRGSDRSSGRLTSRETSNRSAPQSPSDTVASWEKRPESDQRLERRVRFGSQTPRPDTIVATAKTSNVARVAATSKKIKTSDPSLLGEKVIRTETDNDAASNSTGQLASIPKLSSLRNLSTKLSGTFRRSSGGFSGNPQSPNPPSTPPRNSLKAMSGLEEEMARWRRLHHTRVVNARIKAVRGGGRRRSMTLRETMDHAAMARKEEALRPEPFTADKAWGLLHCGYLRLTPSNVETLEDICTKAGYDVTTHPHKPLQNSTAEMDHIFRDIRERRRTEPAVPTHLKFGNALLFKRFSR